MGTAYKIRCRHCGAQFEHHMQPGYGVLPVYVGLSGAWHTRQGNKKVGTEG